jgi:hypothetical protein
MSWARPVIDPLKDALGPYPKSAREVLAAGDVVYVEPLPESKYRLGREKPIWMPISMCCRRGDCVGLPKAPCRASP